MYSAQISHLSEADYLAGERRPGSKHEYVDGQLFAMAGATKAHGTIAGNLFTATRTHLRPPYRAWMADMKVRVAASRSYYYPDVVATCAPTRRRIS